jgi:hypothetical protein
MRVLQGRLEWTTEERRTKRSGRDCSGRTNRSGSAGAGHTSSPGFDQALGTRSRFVPAVVEASKRSNYDSDNVQLSNAMP